METLILPWMWICSRKSNQTELKGGWFSPDQQTKICLVMCGVGKLLSLSWRHQPCSRCQQVSLMSPHPEALFCQCLCNENLFRPVWGMRQRPQGSGKSLYLLLKGARWGGLFQHPNISVPLWSAFLLIHMQFLPRVYSCWTEEPWGKEVYNPRHFCKLLRKMPCFSLSNQIYSWAEYFGGVSGAACLSVCVYLTRGS